MYQYIWDAETGGLLLTSEISKFSKEPRPVYYKELDILGFDRYWNYPKDDSAPLMWAEANNYIYKGRTVARAKGGSVYTAPELVILDSPEPDGRTLEFINVEAMVQKNQDLLETLTQETIQKIYNVYREYKNTVDVFYVAFSGGKDSAVALDLVQRAIPHDDFLVLFGDTRMEFPDTYKVVEQIEQYCKEQGIEFFRAQSKLIPSQSWKIFGPPATTSRWCCSVHKTSPQINLLRKITGKHDFTGMAFTGIRAEESLTRSEYDSVNDGKKHSGQLSCHGILEWNSAELFLYIFARGLIINEAYKKGNSRAGCLVCPNSSGRHEYIKRTCYPTEIDNYLEMIASTSGKTNYSPEEMKMFIDSGYWRTRKSGRELNFGHDCFEVKSDATPPTITVYKTQLRWEMWAKTIGEFYQAEPDLYVIEYLDKLYQIKLERTDISILFLLLNCTKSKDDVRFFSLFRSVIVKTLYCIGCGVCEAECKSHCIDMSNGIKVGDNCIHCHKCHDIHEHCLRYNSIRNKISEGRKMTGLDRYFSFGARAEWMEIFCNYDCGSGFWMSDGDGLVANKKKDAFKNFVQDAGLVVYDKKAEGDKYCKCVPTVAGLTVAKMIKDSAKLARDAGLIVVDRNTKGEYDNLANIRTLEDAAWAIILCNLVYTPAYSWFVNNLKQNVSYTPDSIKMMLSSVMENDLKGLGKRNVVDALKIVMAKTPLGTSHIFAECDTDEKVSASGKETITLNTLVRCKWDAPVAEVILYSLYKFAEACGDYYQFRLRTLMDDSIERDGVSPTRIFGLDRGTMVRILNGLAVNYPEFIAVSFTHDLDTITLRPTNSDLTSEDVLKLF